MPLPSCLVHLLSGLLRQNECNKEEFIACHAFILCFYDLTRHFDQFYKNLRTQRVFRKCDLKKLYNDFILVNKILFHTHLLFQTRVSLHKICKWQVSRTQHFIHRKALYINNKSIVLFSFNSLND